MNLETKEEKEKYLLDNGWYQMYRDDYWVNSSIMAGANLDWCGTDLDGAITAQKYHEVNSKK